MKIITEDAVYVQMNDIMFLNSTDIPIPASIIMQVFGQGITVVNDKNRYDFVKFEESTEIDYFKDLDWIVDYYAVNGLSDAQIKAKIDKVLEERNTNADKYNALPDAEKKHHQDMVSRHEQLEHKAYGLRDLLWFKQGHLEMTLPEEVEYPVGYKTSIKQKIKNRLKRKNKR